MNLFPLRRIIQPFGARTIIHGKKAEHNNKDPEPIKMAYASYEDTKTRDVKDKSESAPILIMHGLFGSKNNWNSICKALQRNTKPARKIIAVDARNHGDSSHSNEHNYEAIAADVLALLKLERIPRIVFMGHSMGGRAAMYFALKHPEMVEKLIVVDISPVSTPPDLKNLWKFFGAMAAVRVPPNSALSTARTAVDAALMSSVPDKNIRAFLLTNLVQKANGLVDWRINLRALRENYGQISKFPITPESGKQYTGPTTFIAGGKSEYLKEEDHVLIKALFPNSKFYTIADAGHWLHSEKPNEFIKIVLNSLNKEL